MKSVKAILVLENNSALSGVTGPVPTVLVEVLGKSTLQRTIDALITAGADEVVVLSDSDSASPEMRDLSVSSAKIVKGATENLWRTAETIFTNCAETATHVFLLRINAYMELNWDAIVQHHDKYSNRITRVLYGEDGQRLDVFLASASRRNEVAFLLRSGLRQLRTECMPYKVGQNNEDEYINLLEHEFDLRRLATDALHLTCNLRPNGIEVRPGIWAGAGSHIERNARLVAPVYVGRRARICANAVITRGSAVEHHCIIGSGTVVENATVLPFTKLGPGLEVCHSIMGQRHIFNLQRNLSTPIQDARLVDQVSTNVGKRILDSTAALVSFMPRQIVNSLFGTPPKSATASPINYAESFKTPDKQPELTAGLAVATRRYGNQ
ncbi:MAG: putative mannose-phosphate guanyltransferase [Candidatus Angelobacter sp.]|nr:putative mannose-phosphate guanyltransferase [Candidatus Angelobacter sp.]